MRIHFHGGACRNCGGNLVVTLKVHEGEMDYFIEPGGVVDLNSPLSFTGVVYPSHIAICSACGSKWPINLQVADWTSQAEVLTVLDEEELK